MDEVLKEIIVSNFALKNKLGFFYGEKNNKQTITAARCSCKLFSWNSNLVAKFLVFGAGKK